MLETGDGADGVGHGQKGEAKGQGNSEKAQAQGVGGRVVIGEHRRQHGTATTPQHEPEGADQFGQKLPCHKRAIHPDGDRRRCPGRLATLGNGEGFYIQMTANQGHLIAGSGARCQPFLGRRPANSYKDQRLGCMHAATLSPRLYGDGRSSDANSMIFGLSRDRAEMSRTAH